ncbi:MAG: threonylcarbamoyl-AMP synthase [Oscillospiraceae bacterium]|nr:threonylcarbamoyl-AMP synthase [Oscillospiraceae bacterium]
MNTLTLLPGDAEYASKLLTQGELVALPTDTVYGLAAVPGLEDAVKKVYEVKSRPLDKALLLLVSDPDALDKFCRADRRAWRLAQAFWPGALTIVLEKTDEVSYTVTSGKDTVGLRCPDSFLSRRIIRFAGGAVAAPSANISGLEPPTNAKEVLAQLDGSIAAVVDGGECSVGTPSTIVDLTGKEPVILREGDVALDEINSVLSGSFVCLGVTGPTGAGKSTVLSWLEKQGALVIDCDKLYHSMLQSDELLVEDIERSFPAAVVNGSVDRKILGSLVFADPEKLSLLSDITGPHICRKTDSLTREYLDKGGKMVVYDAIRVLEGGLNRRCDAVIGVVAPEEERIKRIMKRDGIDEAAARARVAAQQKNEYYVNNCDEVIVNDAAPEELFAKCEQTLVPAIDKIRRGNYVRK